MKRIGFVAMMLCAAGVLFAQRPGEACSTAIPMGKDYSAQVKNGQTIWYSAWTFDLPLTVTFAPAGGKNDPAPEVEMDFTCIPGFYADDILCSLFCKTSTVKFDMPHKPKLDSKTLDDGTFVYYLSLGKRYRDLLLQMGISYNVEVYVKVTYKCNGQISLAPDELFNNCVDNAKFMHYDEAISIGALQDKHLIVPYVQWQEDTIYYKWQGTTPCQFSMSNVCDFNPDLTEMDSKRMDAGTIQPGDSLKVEASLIYDYVHDQAKYPNEAGLYFAKFYSEEPGVVTVVKAKQAPARANATLLRYDRTYALNANETAVFALPKSWDTDKINSKFSTPTEHVFRMYLATDPDFSEEHMLKEYQFEKNTAGHWQGIYGADMVKFWKKTTEQYLYVRFECSEATTITPSEWTVSPCIKNTANFIYTQDTTFRVKRAATGGNYRLIYAQWAGGDMKATIQPALTGTQTCEMWVANDCDIKRVATDANVLYNRVLSASRNTITIKAADIDSWADKVDEDGYIYIQFYHTISGTYNAHLESTAEPEQDPTYPGATIAVQCEGGNVVVKVREAQTIVITNEAGAEMDQWEAVVGEAHELNLAPGKYILQGKAEKIDIKL